MSKISHLSDLKPEAPPDLPTRLPLKGLLLLLTLMLAWGLSWPTMKVAVGYIPVFSFRSFCAVIAAVAIFAMARAAGHRLAMPRGYRGWVVLAGLLNLFGWMFFSALALTVSPTGQTAIIAYTMPLWAFLVGIPLLGERPTALRCLGLLLGMGAIGLLAWRGINESDASIWGVAAMAVGAVMWGAGTVVVKYVNWPVPMLVVTGWQLVAAAVPLTLGMLLEIDSLEPLPPVAMGALLYSALGGIAVGYWIWFRIVEMVPAGVAALSSLAVPGVGVASAALVLGEPVTWVELTALGLLFAALTTVLPLPDLKELFARVNADRG
ncbi:MAG TPA: DMT family transporter [Alphaproteobacteria bacterium]|nr:DMT family transporter [Alphaproteobacteria bacterium]MDP7427348.1 DMT family transporter [Alphaproteobacteria bacterium]HJM50647.1 DMT family transporter [Alphaproteobacteria bacterium]